MQFSRGKLIFHLQPVYVSLTAISSEGAANLNDMKDMLASLPQYQEQREKASHIPLKLIFS